MSEPVDKLHGNAGKIPWNKLFLEEVKGYDKDRQVFEAKNKAATTFCINQEMVFRVLYEKDLTT